MPNNEYKMSKLIICVYCGYHSYKLSDFYYKIKKGYSTKIFQCPICKNRMRKNTLLCELSVSEWARWLLFSIKRYNDPMLKGNKFYNKINFDELKKNIKIMGVANEFWDSWFKAKETKDFIDEHNMLEKKMRSKSIPKQQKLI